MELDILPSQPCGCTDELTCRVHLEEERASEHERGYQEGHNDGSSVEGS